MNEQNPATPSVPSSGGSKKSMWPIAAIIIVGGIVGGIVWGVWRASVEAPSLPPAVTAMTPIPAADDDEKAQALSETSDSTELGPIEDDLLNTNFEGLDAEVGAIGGELQ